MVSRSKVFRSRDPERGLDLWSTLAYLCLLLISCSLPLRCRTGFEVPAEEQFENACIYQRSGKTCGGEDGLVWVLFVGDVMLGRDVSPDEHPFRNTAERLQAADITVANFEGSLRFSPLELTTLDSDQFSQSYNLTAEPSAVRALQSAGFDLLSLANNHSQDAGQYGLEFTVNTFENAGLRVVGAGQNRSSAFKPVILGAKGVRMAFIGLNAIPYPMLETLSNDYSKWQIADWDIDLLEKAIYLARKDADVVVLIVHWGDEYELEPSSGQRMWAEQFVDWGVDVIIGTHPHSIQGDSNLRFVIAVWF